MLISSHNLQLSLSEKELVSSSKKFHHDSNMTIRFLFNGRTDCFSASIRCLKRDLEQKLYVPMQRSSDLVH